jgi:anti-anti-sigma factor
MSMAFEQERVGDVHILRPHGRLDSANAPELERAVKALLEDDSRHMLFDLSQLDYISSAGLRVVLQAGKGARAKQGRLVLAGVGGIVREVFEMSGFLSFFAVADDVPAAMKLLVAE